MDAFSIIIGVLLGVLLCAIAAWLVARTRMRLIREQVINEFNAEKAKLEERRIAAEERNSRIPELESEIQRQRSVNEDLQAELLRLKTELAQLSTKIEEERKAFAEKLALLEEARTKLTDAFSSLAAESLKSNNQSFLELAKTSLEKFQESAKQDLDIRQKSIDELVKPLKESLEKVDTKIEQLERVRISAFVSLEEQLKHLATTQASLQSETTNLVKALRAPTVRGRWGEIQLRRVVELAGMVNYCDFVEQETIRTDDGKLRPDVLIKLPNDKVIVVDAKAPIEAYLDSLNTDSETTRIEKLQLHAQHVRTHISKLSAKAYWDQFQQTPEFVLLFLPGETFYSAALEQDPSLIEFGVDKRVILATPTTLIALLKAVAYGWNQDRIEKNAEEISVLGKTLYDRILKFIEHYVDVKKGLEKTIESYNRSVSSLETRVLVSARRFKELGASSNEELVHIEGIDKIPREFQSTQEILPLDSNEEE